MEKTSLKIVFLFSLTVIALCSHLVDAREMVEEEVNCLGGSCMAPVADIIKHTAVCKVDNDCKIICPKDCRSDSPCVCACNGGNCTCECDA
ncbi:hypothetical protein N665_1117s0011 [Sinapis alba]|nr:hypothetical protein N665_1117s0011 [Sinapis alba]